MTTSVVTLCGKLSFKLDCPYPEVPAGKGRLLVLLIYHSLHEQHACPLVPPITVTVTAFGLRGSSISAVIESPIKFIELTDGVIRTPSSSIEIGIEIPPVPEVPKVPDMFN